MYNWKTMKMETNRQTLVRMHGHFSHMYKEIDEKNILSSLAIN
jgi:hypothetical protein